MCLPTVPLLPTTARLDRRDFRGPKRLWGPLANLDISILVLTMALSLGPEIALCNLRAFHGPTPNFKPISQIIVWLPLNKSFCH
jgi:hypothetical protein